MQSQFPHGYQYDVFVSYSHTNKDWVAAFHSALKKDLAQLGGREFAIFWDEDGLRLGDLWDQKLHTVVANSAIFLPVLSPSFFNSKYCQEEWACFSDSYGHIADETQRGRVFPVEFLPGTFQSESLRKSQTKRFYRMAAKGYPVEFKPNTEDFADAVRDLANELKDALSRMGPKGEQRPGVYLASNYSKDTEALQRSLAHKFDVVLPPPIDQAARVGTEDFQKEVRERLGKCFVSVYPLDCDQTAETYIKRQLEVAKGITKPRLVWTATESAELSQLMNEGFEWFSSQQELEDRVRQLAVQPKPVAVPQTNSDKDIYFLCPDRDNRKQASSLLDYFLQQQINIYLPDWDCPADQAMAKHVRKLEELDGCLVYLGETDREWVDNIILRLRKHDRERGQEQGKLNIAYYLGPPQKEFKEDLKLSRITMFDQPEPAAKFFTAAST